MNGKTYWISKPDENGNWTSGHRVTGKNDLIDVLRRFGKKGEFIIEVFPTGEFIPIYKWSEKSYLVVIDKGRHGGWLPTGKQKIGRTKWREKNGIFGV